MNVPSVTCEPLETVVPLSARPRETVFLTQISHNLRQQEKKIANGVAKKKKRKSKVADILSYLSYFSFSVFLERHFVAFI